MATDRYDVVPPSRHPRELVPARPDSTLSAWPGVHLPRTMTGTPDGLLKMLWRSRWIMLACLVVSVVAGVAYLQKTTPIYTSTSKLYIHQKEVGSLGMDSRMLPRYNLYTQAEVIKSSSVLNEATKGWQNRPMRTFAGSANQVTYLHKSIRVTVGKNDDVITVSLDSPYPAEAADIVNDVVRAYISYRDRNRRTSSADLSSTLQTRVDELSVERNQTLKALTDFQGKNNILLAQDADPIAGMIQGYEVLRATHDAADKQVREALLYKERLESLAKSPAVLQYAIGASAGPYAMIMNERAQLAARLFERRLARTELLEQKQLTEGHPAVATLDAEILHVDARLNELDEQMVAAVLADADMRYAQARADQEYWAKRLEEEQERIRKQNEDRAELRRLNEEYETVKADYQMMIDRQKQIDLNADIDTQEVRVLEVAYAPPRPSRPQRPRVLAMALIAGMLLGGAIAVLRDMLDQTLRSADEISTWLGLPVLGVVPAMSRRQKIQMRGQRVHIEPESSEAEAFRTIRTAVFFGVPKDGAATMLITSPAAGDGKSTLVSNLAIAMAQAGQRTVLLDADFRKPMQNTIFEVPHDAQGLSDVLAGKIKLSDAVRAVSVANLVVLPGGPNVSNPAEILNSPQFAKILTRLAETYDRVIIDAPPVTVVTDAQILGALCNVTILVVRASKSTKHTSKRAIEALRSTGAHLLGVVVNDVRRKGSRYGYYGGYGSYYGSGRNGGKGARGRGIDRSEIGVGTPVAMLTKGGQ